MKIPPIICLILPLVFAGCTTPREPSARTDVKPREILRVVDNLEQLRPGMTKPEVWKILGKLPLEDKVIWISAGSDWGEGCDAYLLKHGYAVSLYWDQTDYANWIYRRFTIQKRPPSLSGTVARAESAESLCEFITMALNQQDWDTLREVARPGMRANDYITAWEAAAKAGRPVRVGKWLRSEPYLPANDQLIAHSFEWESKEGSFDPHVFQVVLREEKPGPLGKESFFLLEDFWNFGW